MLGTTSTLLQRRNFLPRIDGISWKHNKRTCSHFQNISFCS